MAQSSVIQVRVDEDLKRAAEQLFQELGLDVPSAVRLFLKQAILHNGIPFAISGIDGFYNDKNIQVLAESIRQLEAGKTVSKSMTELQALADA